MAEMTPRQRVEAVVRGQAPDRVPFIIWNNKLPGGAFDRALLAAGTCVIVKSQVMRRTLATIRTEQRDAVGPDGRPRRRTVYHTPAGDLDTTIVPLPYTTWVEAPLFKGPDDYGALLAVIRDERYAPDPGRFAADDRRYGPCGLARPATEKSPLFEIIYELMGLANFAIEWHERRSRVLEVFDALAARQQDRLAIVAGSAAQYVIVEGNMEISVVGTERFDAYYAPSMRSACERMHAAGKCAGAHLDGNNHRLADRIAALPLDLIESFTPPPDCDLPLSEALRAWPDKSLMVHFPSSVHLRGPEAVRAAVADQMDQAGDDKRRVIFGAIEDVPRPDTPAVLAQAVRDLGRIE